MIIDHLFYIKQKCVGMHIYIRKREITGAKQGGLYGFKIM